MNAMFYALLTELVAKDVDMIPGELWLTGTDVHIYVDQIDGIKEQLKRDPFALPKLKWNVKRNNVWDFEPSDVGLVNYVHHENIKFAVAK